MKKLPVAVPAITLAAALSLTACGSAKAPVAKPAVTVTHTVTAKPAPAMTTHSAKPKPVQTTPTPAPTAAAALPTVSTDWAMDSSAFVVEPSQIGTSADGTGDMTGITWSSWTASNAEGSGSIALDNGVPNMAQGTVVNVPVSIALSAPVNGSFTAMTVTDHAGNENTYSFGGSSTYGLGVDDPAPSAAPAATPSPASANSPAAGAPSCTTIAGYYPGGQPGHLNSTGFCVMDGENGNT